MLEKDELSKNLEEYLKKLEEIQKTWKKIPKKCRTTLYIFVSSFKMFKLVTDILQLNIHTNL